MLDVICVGVLVADAIARPVKNIPQKGKLELVDNIALYTGGCAANSGVDMARLGVGAGIMGNLGDDGFGSFMKEALEKEGVSTAGLQYKKGVFTSASLVIVTEDGERSFIHSTGANGVFCEKDINYDIIRESQFVFVAGTMLMPQFDGEECALFLQKCKAMGKTTILDTAWDSRGRWMSVLRSCMPYIDYFLPSLDEARMLASLEEPEAIADYFLSLGPKTVAVKLGEDGCLIKTAGEKAVRVPAFCVQAVDATGAGDSFCAGFITGLVRGWPLEKCGLFANAVGAHCVMAPGASGGIPSEDKIWDFIEKYNGGNGK